MGLTYMESSDSYRVETSLANYRPPEELNTASAGPSTHAMSVPTTQNLGDDENVEVNDLNTPAEPLSDDNQSVEHPQSDSDSPSDDDCATHVRCWIPALDIDLVVLAKYLKIFVDDAATIRPSKNPQNLNKVGYTIGAKTTLSVAGCRDIIFDARAWEKEKGRREYREHSYHYNYSDAWCWREKAGASPGHVNPRIRKKVTQVDATAQADDHNDEGEDCRDTESDASHNCDDDGDGDGDETPPESPKADPFDPSSTA